MAALRQARSCFTATRCARAKCPAPSERKCAIRGGRHVEQRDGACFACCFCEALLFPQALVHRPAMHCFFSSIDLPTDGGQDQGSQVSHVDTRVCCGALWRFIVCLLVDLRRKGQPRSALLNFLPASDRGCSLSVVCVCVVFVLYVCRDVLCRIRISTSSVLC